MIALIPLSIPQKEILFDQLLHPDGASYNISNILEIKGKIDTTILQAALAYILNTNPMLGGKIVEQDADYFFEYGAHPIQFEINPKEIVSCTKAAFYDYCQHENQTTINIFNGEPLYKFVGLDIGDCFLIYLKFHHIVIDGIGVSIFFSNLASIYTSLLKAESISPTIFGSYQQYLEKQQHYLISEQYTFDQTFWREYLSPTLEFGYEGLKSVSRTQNATAKNRFQSIHVEKKTYNNLLEKLQTIGINDFHYAMIVLTLSLKKVFDLDNPIICLPMANRWDENAKKTLGHFVSALPFLVNLNIDEYPDNFLTDFKNVLKKSYPHQSYFHSHIIRDIKQKFHEETNIGDISFSYHKKKMDYQYGEFQSEYDLLNMDGNRAISIYFGDNNTKKGPKIDFSFGENLFSQQQCDYFTSCFEKYYAELHNWLDKPFKVILSGIELINPNEKNILLETVTSSPNHQPNSKTIIDLFAAQVVKIPDHIALVHQGRTLTLSELHNKSNQLANYILSKDVKPESIIGLLFEPSFDMVIGILGVLKAGYAYLPLDPDLPASRKGFMLKDCNCTLLLSHSSLEVPGDYSGVTVLLDKVKFNKYSKEQPNIQIHPNQLAYIIYTSGTTGQPKGAMLTHQNIANYTQWFVEEANISSADKTVLLASYAFDGSYTNIYSCFVSGCTLFLASRDEVLNVDVMLDFIEMNGISFLKMTPTYFNTLFITPSAKLKKLNSLKLIALGGEAIRTEDVEKFHTQFSGVQIMNHYGPTETTVGSVYQMIDFDAFEYFKQQPTIGKPIANTQIYLLDSYSQLVPYGVEGEIYIGGNGLARGYLNREDLTKEKFIDHPYKPGERLYCTGDKGRWMPNGNLAFLGRKDEQVKIRGYRIELGEIEAILLKHQAVDACVVVTNNKRNNQTELVAYASGSASTDELRNYLKEKLPSYMVPTHFVRLESIPFNSNGKINKKALPPPTQNETKEILLQPLVKATEITLAKIWSEMLEIPIDKIHLHADFFELGGNSILAIQLMRKIKSEMEIELELKTIFNESTILLLSSTIDKREKKVTNPNLLHFCSSKERKYIFSIPHFFGLPTGLDYLYNNLSGYNGYGFIYTDKEDFIDYCVRTIITIAKDATYISLVGVCTGGQLAFSIIQKLEISGVKVDLLLMYDSHYKTNNNFLKDVEIENALKQWRELLKEDGYTYSENANFFEETITTCVKYTRNHVMQGKIKCRIINLSTTQNIFNASIQNSWKRACSEYYTTLIEGTHANMLVAPFRKLNNLIGLNIYNLEKKGKYHLKLYLYKEKFKTSLQYIKSKINSIAQINREG